MQNIFKAFLVLFFFLNGWSVSLEARQVYDQLGRQVKIPANPMRIVSLAPSVTECVFALNQGNRLVGVTMFSDYPPQAAQLYKVGSYVNLDLEKIVSLHPDLCLATKDGNPIDVIKRLENIGIPVYALDPRDLPTVLETIEVLGGLLNATQQANAVSDNMRQRIELVKNRVAKCQWNPRVFFQIGIAPIVSVGKQTFIHELISLAGGVNAASGPTDYPRFSREEVLVLRPDIIVINSMTKDDKLLERAIEQWNRFPNIPAVKNKRIYSVNSDYFDRASPRLVSGLEILAKLFHPRIFSDLESVD